MFDDEVPLWEYSSAARSFSYCCPDGKYIVEPVFDQETIIIAELDLNAVDWEKMTLDVSGHYSRADIFDFRIGRGKETRSGNS
nr:hypothetical protein [Chthoniobacterales bacterium]